MAPWLDYILNIKSINFALLFLWKPWRPWELWQDHLWVVTSCWLCTLHCAAVHYCEFCKVYILDCRELSTFWVWTVRWNWSFTGGGIVGVVTPSQYLWISSEDPEHHLTQKCAHLWSSKWNGRFSRKLFNIHFFKTTSFQTKKERKKLPFKSLCWQELSAMVSYWHVS